MINTLATLVITLASPSAYANTDANGHACQLEGTPLVNISCVDPTIKVDMRYATTNNFTGEQLTGYNANVCYLTEKATNALRNANQQLRRHSLGIKVFDCYRPTSASDDMIAWANRTGHEDYLGVYIGSRSEHNKGTTVDAGIIDTLTGKELDLGKYDEFSEMADVISGKDDKQKGMRTNFRKLMIKNGFVGYSKEWWHFTEKDGYNNKANYPRYNVSIN